MKTQTFIRLLLASILLPLLWWQVATSTGACDPEFVVSEGVSCQTESAAEASPLLTLLGTVRPRFTLSYVDSVNTIPIGGLDPTLEALIRPAVPTATATPAPTTTPTTPPGVTPATATNTPPTTPTTRAATNTPTPTPSVTPTAAPPTPTTPSQPGDGDRYETDDACAAAKPVTTDGIPQQRTFHDPGDIDWVRFDAQQDERYLIHVDVPNSSPADVALELRGNCGGVTERAQDHAFSPGIRLEFDAPTAGPIHLRLTNHSPEIAGDHVTYTLSVRTLRQTAEPGALILVAGKIQDNDDVQPNIYHVTDTVYNLFLSQGYAPDDIYYLAPDLSRANVDGMATTENLQAAITQWAAERVDANHPLTVYLMDHGSSDTLFLDKQRGEWVTPDQLDSWLTTLEMTICGSAENRCLPVNVIVEACYSGSFISMPGTVSRPGRVVVTSTDDRHLAWATDRGASFSDHFLRALAQGNSLYGSYMVARAAAAAFLPQQAWLDGDGDGNPHDDGSQTIAAQRGFTFRNGFDDIWQPYIKATALERTEDGRVHIRAQVLDDVTVDHVWAIIYAPSYQPPTAGDALVKETLTTVTLLDEGGGWFGAVSNEFTEAGRYQVLIHAEDNDDFAAPPVRVGWDNGSRIFLPLVVR